MRGSRTIPLPPSSVSTPCDAPGSSPSIVTRKPTLPRRLARAHDQVHVARVEAEREPAAGLVELDAALVQRPAAGQGPLVELEPRRQVVHVAVERGAAGGREVPGSLVAEVGLGRPHVLPDGGHLVAARHDVHELVLDIEQALDRPLGLLVRALAEVVVANLAVRVGEVEGRPVLVGERLPDAVVVVDGDRVFDTPPGELRADVVELVLERELGRVHADDREALRAVLLAPRTDVGERAEPVDARVRAEVERNHAAAQGLGRQRLGVEPRGRAVERRDGALCREMDTLERVHELTSAPTARCTSWTVADHSIVIWSDDT